MGRKGGTITSTGGQQQLDVRYHCQRPGEAIVTVSIPLEIYEDVTFSFRKVCKKKPVIGYALNVYDCACLYVPVLSIWVSAALSAYQQHVLSAWVLIPEFTLNDL